jgi:hypothetical protein
MKKRSVLPLLLAAATLSLSACAFIQRQAVFRESDFAWSGGGGSGAVIGQSAHFKEAEDPSLVFESNTTISMVPVNEYTSEMIHFTFEQAGNILTPADPRYARYVRTTKTDQQGRFAFHHLPPGDYYVMATITVYQRWANLNNEFYGQVTPMYVRVSVRNGQTVQVTNWNG